eukprot:CAMPEP_0197185210 /NCGR_PEP_ID=MMETSP1423-20130617/11440_1 /TAXON_ID=476441 /ORGANISM="Pseudo-nitzschia heimii, Strain UNC1101" /LENGTH=377 /DNA_ID=CAMNT_0042636213 /DNA_START=35 /DNA_END=1165 /DNA_ORIENTATION=+
MNEASPSSMLDRSIKATADNAMMAKLATTRAGYYVDPFLDAFYRYPDKGSCRRIGGSSAAAGSKTGGEGNSRMRTIQPIIKRGTHARVCVIDRVISCFLKMKLESPAPTACQVVVLGAGKDTSYFRCRNGILLGDGVLEEKAQGKEATGNQQQMCNYVQRRIDWYEVDHVSVVEEKASLIRKSNILKPFCPLLVKTKHGYESLASSNSSKKFHEQLDTSPLSSSSYHLVGHDLRDSPSTLLEKLDLDPTLPTLFVMECVSMYIPITQSKDILQAVSLSTETVFIACYEPILGNRRLGREDPFGSVMERNFVKMGVVSPESCLLHTRTLKDQLKKLIECDGFSRAVGCDMSSAYETIVTDAQRRRANQSEFMDEYEEW